MFRTNFAGGIITEFLPPKHFSNQVVILCDGLPSGGSKQQLVTWFAGHGFWTFHLRYRGTWESGGTFLDHAPEQDVFDVIEGLKNDFHDVWSGQIFSCQPEHICVVGSSFGGTVALMASLDARVHKVLTISPVIDWTVSADEPIDWLEAVLLNGFPGAYRFTHEHWLQLSRGEFFQPMQHVKEFDAKKIFLVHACDDRVVPIEPTHTFIDRVGCDHRLFKTGGHHLRPKIFRWPLSAKLIRWLHAKV